ncbi:hypothetical protein LRR18_02580 [Mangrovimonas sp. AS39]|uniref:hypothetical protein n=1 Tax=Mangrovimonas futianensis TaxID=2895523 RepID=UPI001E299EAD|nr:hypothetical protein [Mangrovimonas futianensis]MCF1190454.1 hypothetical protein [Mangrovimonas futianensis]MCF1193794.1 hypothetical protein [Mangrovimonas futianensis]
MKKKLEAELMSIAHRILKLKGKDDIDKMHREVAALYEKLTVLKFARDNFQEDLPTIESDSSFFDLINIAFNHNISDNIEIDDKIYINLDDNEHEEIMEPAIEKIKDLVAHMPQESQQVDELFEKAIPNQPKYHKNDFDEITADFKETPVFEPLSKQGNGKKSLNDHIKRGGFTIGLNDKLAFIKHLFGGNSQDYDRVISQINTLDDFEDAENLIQNMIKPDHNNWAGKEEFEERFMEIIERKFN